MASKLLSPPARDNTAVELTATRWRDRSNPAASGAPRATASNEINKAGTLGSPVGSISSDQISRPKGLRLGPSFFQHRTNKINPAVNPLKQFQGSTVTASASVLDVDYRSACN